MKRFLLFAGDCYYPDGGALDFRGDFGNLQNAINYHSTLNIPTISGGWAHVFDFKEKKIVKWYSTNSGEWTDQE